jgi:hypothetical protein
VDVLPDVFKFNFWHCELSLYHSMLFCLPTGLLNFLKIVKSVFTSKTVLVLSSHIFWKNDSLDLICTCTNTIIQLFCRSALKFVCWKPMWIYYLILPQILALSSARYVFSWCYTGFFFMLCFTFTMICYMIFPIHILSCILILSLLFSIKKSDVGSFIFSTIIAVMKWQAAAMHPSVFE